jgi:hypothetical protein
MKGRKLTFIKVTTTSIYAYENVNGMTANEVIEDWFTGYPMEQHHATRDTSRIGNTTRVQSAEVISEKAFDEYIEEMKKKA